MLHQNFLLLLFMKMKLSAFGLIINYGKIFISTDYEKNTPFIFATTLDDHSENTMFLKSARRYRLLEKTY